VSRRVRLLSGGLRLAALLLALNLLPARAATVAPPAPEAAAPAPTLAIVAEDRVALRAAPRASAQQHALLWAGDTLEVRGERLDDLQVYDHRRERAGYVRASQVRRLPATAAQAPELLAVVRFLRELPGAEALGVGYVAAYLRAAPPEAIDAEVFDALGGMVDRLLRRASVNRVRAQDEALAAQVEVIRAYGIGILSYEHEGRVQLCSDGDADRRVMALPATAAQRARAALALTRPQCMDPSLSPLARHAHDDWRADVLDRVPLAELPAHQQARIRLRQAGVWAAIAHHQSRRGESPAEAAETALAALAAVDRSQLAEGDAEAYQEAAIRVGASRWATEAAPAPRKGLDLTLKPGAEPGQICLTLLDAGKAQFERCSYATLWPASFRAHPAGTLATVAAQPLAGWRELWVFRKAEDGWRLDVLPPAEDIPDLGYIEFAGWLPEATKLLAAREARHDGRYTRTFELIDLDLLRVEKRAEEPEHLSPFYRWQDPAWKRMTVSLRR